MAGNIKLGIQIGATVTGGFGRALGSAKTKLGALGSEIKTLGSQRALIERFEKDQAALDAARLAMAKNSKELGKLKLALRKDPQNAGLAKDLAATQAKAEKLSAALEKQKSRLSQTGRALDKAGLAVGDLGRDYTRLGAQMDKARAKFQRLDTIMSRKSAAGARLGELKGQMLGLAGAVYGAGKVLGAAMDFESAMADVRKVVNFPEPDGLKKLGATLKQMSREIPISADGLAQIAAAGGQLGIAANDLPAFTETVAKMATAFDMLPEEAGDAMAKLANVYQIPIGEMGKLGDAINHLSDNTAAKARDIVPVLQRAGGMGRQFGLSAVQVAALGDAFVALGKPPEVAGTAINALLAKLQTATHQGSAFQNALAQMGMSADGLEQAIGENAQGALTDFLVTLSNIDKSDRAGILTDLFGLEYSDDISLLAGSMDQYRKALKLVGDESVYAGSMTREFENRSATTANQLTLLKNAANNAAINIGSVFLPAINAVVKPLAAVAGWIAGLNERMPWLMPVLGGVAGALLAMKTAMIIGTAAVWLFNTALAANPIVWVVAAIGGAAALIIKYWEPIKGFFKGLWGWLKNIFAEGVKFLTKVWEVSPLGLLFKAGKKLASFGGAMLGKIFGDGGGTAGMQPALAGGGSLPAGALDLPARGANSSTVNAPITINAHPGMDEKAVAEEVDRKLREREKQAAARKRGVLHD